MTTEQRLERIRKKAEGMGLEIMELPSEEGEPSIGIIEHSRITAQLWSIDWAERLLSALSPGPRVPPDG